MVFVICSLAGPPLIYIAPLGKVVERVEGKSMLSLSLSLSRSLISAAQWPKNILFLHFIDYFRIIFTISFMMSQGDRQHVQEHQSEAKSFTIGLNNYHRHLEIGKHTFVFTECFH